tara:strand:- start:139 stop:927 length:789 start_codon:yes stop_codon:yes gene_type:complete
MKYYLIIGYQLIEKNKEFPIIRVFIDDRLIDEFICDNEKSAYVSVKFDRTNNRTSTFYDEKVSLNDTYRYSTPEKIKILEVDSEIWTGRSKLTIEVKNNDSNYNNGFMSKRSIVKFNPVFLIRKDIFDDSRTVYRIVQSLRQARQIHRAGDKRTKWDSCKRIIWPGPNMYFDDDDTGGHFILYKGGDHKIELDIKKKHKTYILSYNGQQTKGYFHVDKFFIAWYQYFSKTNIEVQINRNVDMNNNSVNERVRINVISSINEN